MPSSRIGPHVLDSRVPMNADPSGSVTTVDPHPFAVADDAPIRDRGELLLPFVRACKPKSEFRIGAEAEKFGVFEDTFAPVHYRGARSVETILRALVDRHGWVEESEYPGAPTIALRRGDGSVTLEPGAQLELSGAPLPNVHLIVAELISHLTELKGLSRELGIRWLGLGFHPFARQEDLDWVPKSRYAIMREYLPTRGQYGLDMMRRTSTVQANFDYSSEKDAMRKLRVSLKLGPLTTALFANSPFVEGKITGELSRRARVWLDVDPDRTGLLPQTWREGAGFEDYVEWALDCPMFMFKREGHAVDNRGQKFRDFLDHGFQGHRPTLGDWETHLNTLFPEVRLKRTIEIRGADSLPTDLFAALPALWTGILYDDRALDEADALTADFQHDELLAIRARVPFEGLRATFRGAPLAKLAERVLDLARGGLERRAIHDRDGHDERVHLQALEVLVGKGMTPADELREGLADGAQLKAEILARAAL
jgi:glutamate--cysteine ligase